MHGDGERYREVLECDGIRRAPVVETRRGSPDSEFVVSMLQFGSSCSTLGMVGTTRCQADLGPKRQGRGCMPSLTQFSMSG